MTLEPCPVCGKDVELTFSLNNEPWIVCYTCGIHIEDPDGSKWNRISLDARLGQMARENGLTIIDGPVQGTFCWRIPGSNDLSGAFTSKDDVIRDAWRTLREGK